MPTHVDTHIHTGTLTHAYAHMWTHPHTHTRTHVHTHMHAHAHMHTHTLTHMRLHLASHLPFPENLTLGGTIRGPSGAHPLVPRGLFPSADPGLGPHTPTFHAARQAPGSPPNRPPAQPPSPQPRYMCPHPPCLLRTLTSTHAFRAFTDAYSHTHIVARMCTHSHPHTHTHSPGHTTFFPLLLPQTTGKSFIRETILGKGVPPWGETTTTLEA